jgi:hypothetical protein
VMTLSRLVTTLTALMGLKLPGSARHPGVLGSAQTSGVEIAGLGRPTAGRLHLRLRHVLFTFGSFEES